MFCLFMVHVYTRCCWYELHVFHHETEDSLDLVCFFQKFASLDKQTRPSFHTYKTPYYSRFYYSEDIKAFFELLQAFKYVFVWRTCLICSGVNFWFRCSRYRWTRFNVSTYQNTWMALTRFRQTFSLYFHWKQNTRDFMMFPGCIKKRTLALNVLT